MLVKSTPRANRPDVKGCEREGGTMSHESYTNSVTPKRSHESKAAGIEPKCHRGGMA